MADSPPYGDDDLIAGIPIALIEEALRHAAADPSLSRYELGEILGEGAHGTVFRARDRLLDQEVAFKIARGEVLASSDLMERFKGDAVALNRCVYHPNIVRLLDAQSSRSYCFITTELCPLGSLAGFLEKLPPEVMVPPLWAADLIAQVAAGVSHAHAKGILHRDLKPSNILLTLHESIGGEEERVGGWRRMCPKVADFGLAKIVGTTERTAVGTRMGSIPYLSPEQARGESAGVGPGTDVYALGVILHELLTRRPMFPGENDVERLLKIARDEPIPPRSLRRDLDKDLQAICLKCLEKDPNRRYLTPSELANDLERYLKGIPPLIPRPNLVLRRFVATAQRRPGLFAGVILTAALGLGGLTFREMMRRGERDILLRQVDAAAISSLPEILAKLDRTDDAVKRHFKELFGSVNRNWKLAGALALAGESQEYENHAYSALLNAEPREIEPIAKILLASSKGLLDRLGRDIRPRETENPADSDRIDRERANAAAALFHLDQPERAFPLLDATSDPQARTILIHELGAGGIKPRMLLDLVSSVGEPAVRRSLLQAIGEVPDSSWTSATRREAEAAAFLHYERDDDPGVHGAAKWLLTRWNLDAARRAIDTRLAGLAAKPSRYWRINRSGLTMIRFRDPNSGREIEVSDTEIPLRLFREFRPNHMVASAYGSRPDSPATEITFNAAVAFCNWLSRREEIPEDQSAFVKGTVIPLEPAPSQFDRTGYRLPTPDEFAIFARAGVKTGRYHGNSVNFMEKYVWCLPWASNNLFLPIGQLKPNDLGIFDVLGNAHEIAQMPGSDRGIRNIGALVGGRSSLDAAIVNLDTNILGMSVNQNASTFSIGFRVCRTVVPAR